MNRTVKRLLRKAGLYRHYQNWMMRRRQLKEFREWEKGDRSIPPHLIKQKVLREYATNFNLRTFVETGTMHGDMVEAMKDSFDRIYSIELSKELNEEAAERFRDDKNVTLIQGDSGVELKKVVEELKEPALFWLDGHYSGGYTARGEEDTPIYRELAHIMGSPESRHVIIIDDARCFGAEPTYPSIVDLKEFITTTKADVVLEVKGDSIRITPEMQKSRGG